MQRSRGNPRFMLGFGVFGWKGMLEFLMDPFQLWTLFGIGIFWILFGALLIACFMVFHYLIYKGIGMRSCMAYPIRNSFFRMPYPLLYFSFSSDNISFSTPKKQEMKVFKQKLSFDTLLRMMFC